MVVEGEEIPDIVVEQFTLEVMSQSTLFRAGDMVLLSMPMHPFRRGCVHHRFVDCILQKLRRAGKIRFVGGYWSVVGA